MSKPCDCNTNNNNNCCPDADLQQDLISGYTKLCELGDKLIREKRYGHKCEEDICEKTEELTGIIETLESETKKRLQGVQTCLNCTALQSLRERLTSITGINCGLGYTVCDVDESEKEAWVIKNPRCASYEDWQAASYWFCRELKLDTTLEVEKVCNITLAITKDVICDVVLLAVNTALESKKLDLRVKRSVDECKIDFKLLHTEVDCNLTLKTYLELIDHNISFDVIRTVYENNLELKVDRKEVKLVTLLGDFALEELELDTSCLGIEELEKIKEKLSCDYR